MDSKKIVIVQVALSHGGAERVGVLLANGFNKRGHHVSIYTDLTEPVIYQVDDGIHIVDFIDKRSNKILKWIKAYKYIRRNIKKEHPDVIIGIMGLCTFVTYLACIGLKIPIIMTEHNSFERPQSAPFSKKDILFKYILNHLYEYITVLTTADKLVIGNRFKNVVVMPNPLTIEPTNGVPKKKKIILAAGRLTAWEVKGFDVLIKAWKKIQDLNDNVNDDDNLRDWWLKIAGDGKKESFEYLMNLLPDGEWVFNDNDDDNDNKSAVWRSEKYQIEFLGFRKDIEELYKKSEIFVLSSRYEGFGLVLIEAMSQGCAPVACDYKGRQREILNPSSALPEGEGEPNRKIEITENGILCEPDDVEALTSALTKMMEDEEYREKVQRNAVERSKFYDMGQTMDRWENLIEKILY